jgi:hypothetical protein
MGTPGMSAGGRAEMVAIARLGAGAGAGGWRGVLLAMADFLRKV